MKILRFLSNHFYVVNFFISSLIIGLLYGAWYLPNVTEKSITQESSKPTLAEDFSNNKSSQVEVKQAPPIGLPPQSKSNNYESVQKNGVQNNTFTKTNQAPRLPERPADNLNFPQEPLENQIARQSPTPTQVNTYLGHYPFIENSRQNLVKVGNYYDRTEFLDRETAGAFQKMQADSKKQGIKLIIISGFRSVADQEKLFKRQIERKGGKDNAARYSAPPGHSEHHTGYALDIGDGNNPNTDLKVAFETTPAFQWLVNNAYQYGFELSFPPNNSQGVSYEPWHWRHVTTERANQIFAHARINF
jgi:LAS superfamily LD-carboxypeptidase LdcB